MNNDERGEFIVDFLTVLVEVGSHVSTFQLAMKAGRFADARRSFIKARNNTLRLKLSPGTSRVARTLLNTLRDEMLGTLRDYGLKGAFRLVIGR